MRGEYIPVLAPPPPAKGSPPLARGIHLDFLDFVRAVRITPACAGNTLSPKNKGRQTEDHPRLRGEYKERAKKSRPSWGSPPLARGIPPTITNVEPISGITPLARGIHVCGVKHNKRPRITPACAGNTGSSGNSAKIGRDHPRLRGEYSSIPSTSASI